MTYIRIRHKQAGGHHHARVFVGRDEDHLALAGNLAFREDERDQEWTEFKGQLRFGKIDFVDESEPAEAEA